MQESAQTAQTNMGLFKNCRPITVDARQCIEAGTIATDLGFCNIERGDWIIRGEDGESYILNDEAFQRTFAPVEEREWSRESRGAPESIGQPFSNSSWHPAGRRVRGRRTHRSFHAARKRDLPMR